jgi:ribosomal protein L30/L7E
MATKTIKITQTVEVADTPSNRGMVQRAIHMLKVDPELGTK